MSSSAIDRGILLRTPTTRPAELRPRQALAAPRRQPAVLRLTRRGRVLILLTLIVALGFFAMRGAPAASTDIVHHTRTATVVVSPGDTVWGIARRVAPDSDTRSVVAEIEQLNSLSDSGSIRVGQPLLVPAS